MHPSTCRKLADRLPQRVELSAPDSGPRCFVVADLLAVTGMTAEALYRLRPDEIALFVALADITRSDRAIRG